MKLTNHEPVFCLPWKRSELAHPQKSIYPQRTVQWIGLRETTCPIYSTLHVVNWKSEYSICDRLQAKIVLRNWKNQTKSYGGDYVRAVITSRNPYASANADYLFDYGNGTYMAYFTLRWPAKDAEIIVTLVHPREAVDILRRLLRVVPNRFAYTGRFNEEGNVTRGENRLCHVYEPLVYTLIFTLSYNMNSNAKYIFKYFIFVIITLKWFLLVY